LSRRIELSAGGQGRRRSVDLRFFRPALNSGYIPVTRCDTARLVAPLRFVERVLNSNPEPVRVCRRLVYVSPAVRAALPPPVGTQELIVCIQLADATKDEADLAPLALAEVNNVIVAHHYVRKQRLSEIGEGK